MDIEAYMQDVRQRLTAAAERRHSVRSSTLGPLAPIQDRRREAETNLRELSAQIREQKEAALKQASIAGKERRRRASEEAARIYREADQQAKELRSTARTQNENERERIIAEYDARLAQESDRIRAMIESAAAQEAAALEELGNELDDAEGQYRAEYESVVSERIITRKALASMGFEAPPQRRQKVDVEN